MRITKIYLRKYSRLTVFTAGVAVSFFVCSYIGVSESPIQSPVSVVDSSEKLTNILDGYTIESSMNPPNVAPSFVLVDDNVRLSSSQLYAMGYKAESYGSCQIEVFKGNDKFRVNC